METIELAIIGGSGLYDIDGLTDVTRLSIDTPFGKPSDVIIVGKLNSRPVAFLSRHGKGHRYSPSKVPYRANIFALKTLGVKRLVSVSACGSLREHLRPGTFVIPDQLVDQTKYRVNTFFQDDLVAHISVADPFCPQLSSLLADAVAEVGGTVQRGGNLVTIEGPRFSTKAESYTFRQWNMDLINMTTCPEAFLAREAEICYAVMNAISDYDVWHDTNAPVTVEMVLDILKRNASVAQRAIAALIERLDGIDKGDCTCSNALGNALITDKESVSNETLAKLQPLLVKYWPE